MKTTWLDRSIGFLAPRWQLQRVRARLAMDMVHRHYEAASTGRRTENWARSAGDANAVLGYAVLSRLREVARDLVRNNPYAGAALATICDHTVGWGIVPKPNPKNDQALAIWKAWAETPACDADGRHDIYGLQTLVMSTVVESGEVLVRYRMRLPQDGLPLPMQLEVLEPDYLDTYKTQALPTGGQIVQGVEFDPIGRRVAYWLYPSHPGASFSASGTIFGASRRVPASEVLHVFKTTRPGQVRGPSWFAPVILRAKDFDEYEDAQLLKQKIAACLTVLTTDPDGTTQGLGTTDDTKDPATDLLQPGAILNLAAGRAVEVVTPPNVGDYDKYAAVTLRGIATGLHVGYEDLTGDFSGVNFSSARMARLRHWARVDGWRWKMLIPQFCDPVWARAMTVARIAGLLDGAAPSARWTPPPMPMIEPDKEGLAVQRNVRTGIQTLYDAMRERGYDPEEMLAEIAETNKKLDDLGIVLDSDPRHITQAGQGQSITIENSRKAPGWVGRFAALLRSMPDDRATEILRAMFSDEAA